MDAEDSEAADDVNKSNDAPEPAASEEVAERKEEKVEAEEEVNEND